MNTELEAALNDLIHQRQRVNAELGHELYRCEQLSGAAQALKALNEQAERMVLECMDRIQGQPQIRRVA